MDTSFNIVKFIEDKSIARLSKDYNNKLIDRIKEEFTDTQQQLFVSSFYCYLNYHTTNDFVIDLDNIWNWMGFNQKYAAKRLLEKYFAIDKDYKILLPRSGEQDNEQHGGHNKQTILLNIKTFKLFCIKSGTQKANDIHDYFIKLEEILHHTIEEECDELKKQLETQKNKLNSNQIEKELSIEKILLEQFPINVQCVYYGLIDNTNDKNEKIIKFGNSNNLRKRVETHKNTFINFRLINAFKVDNKTHIENAIKECEELQKNKRMMKIKNANYTELLAINENLSFEKLDNIIKNIIINDGYTRDNYNKILKENKLLKENNDKLKNEIKKFKDVVLKKITEENNRLKMEYNNLIKLNRKQIENTIEEEKEQEQTEYSNVQIENKIQKPERKRIKQFTKHKDGYFYINNIKYEKLTGNRQEVWEEIAYRTPGGLTKSGLIINNYGKVVSKNKSEYSSNDMRLFSKK